MFADTQPTTPVTVRLDQAGRDGGPGALTTLTRSVGAALMFAVYAPLLTGATLAVLAWGGLVLAGDYTTAALLAACAVVLALALWRYRPDLLASVAARVVGEAYRAAVYRPRWDTACHAAGLVTRAGSTSHVPGLVRHTRTTTGVDVLLVRIAPGQTLTDWRDASASLAATFTAHAITVRAADRPGWVLLDVLRCDPLAWETVAPDPARHTTTSTSTTGTAVALPVIPAGRAARALTAAAAVMHQLTSRAGVPALTTTAHTPDPRAVVLGRDEYGHPVTLNPYATPHVGMQGATRSGKTSTTYTLLAALAHRPDVIVCGVDPTGLLLDPFTTEHGGRGGAFIATGTSRDDITHAATVLADVVGFMDARIHDLRTSGTDKLTCFTASLPAMWVVLEEFPGLIAAAKALDAEAGTKAGERLAPKITAALGRLVKEGAKVGIFVLILAQRMSADAVSTDDRMNLALRITLRVDNGDAIAMLHDGATRALVDTVRDFAPGIALVESPGHGIRRVRMYYTAYPTYRARVAAGITATAPAPTLTTDGTPGVDVVGEVVTLPTVDEGQDAGVAA